MIGVGSRTWVLRPASAARLNTQWSDIRPSSGLGTPTSLNLKSPTRKISPRIGAGLTAPLTGTMAEWTESGEGMAVDSLVRRAAIAYA